MSNLLRRRSDRLLWLTIWAAAAGAPASTQAAEDGLTVEGYVGIQSRVFSAPPLHQGQTMSRFSSLLVVSPKLRLRDETTSTQFVFSPKLTQELNDYDGRRNSFDIQEAKLTVRRDDWWLVGGVAIVFWGKLESRQMVDIINQRDLALAMDPNDKLGQPLLNIGTRLGNHGALELYWLPQFREGTFPGKSGRLRGNIPIDVDQAKFNVKSRRNASDHAIRYSASTGPIDIGVAYFRGTGREPRMVVGKDRRGEDVLIPHYDLIYQGSIDAQATMGPALFKLEAARRLQNHEYYSMVGLGLEYTFFDVRDTNVDVAIIGELIRDTRSIYAPPSTFDSEVFLGFRTSFNDTSDTSLLGGVVIDRNTLSKSYLFNFETRLYQRLSLKIQGQAFSATRPSELVLHQLRRDNNLRISLNYYL